MHDVYSLMIEMLLTKFMLTQIHLNKVIREHFYAQVGSILVLACPSVRPSVCACVRPFKNNSS